MKKNSTRRPKADPRRVKADGRPTLTPEERHAALAAEVKAMTTPHIGRPRALSPSPALYTSILALASLGCTQEEAAGGMSCSQRTFKQFLAEDELARDVWERGHSQLKISLRRKQLKIAETNPIMAIFLGKNYLEQRDRVEHVGGEGGAIQHEVTAITPDIAALLSGKASLESLRLVHDALQAAHDDASERSIKLLEAHIIEGEIVPTPANGPVATASGEASQRAMTLDEMRAEDEIVPAAA